MLDVVSVVAVAVTVGVVVGMFLGVLQRIERALRRIADAAEVREGREAHVAMVMVETRRAVADSVREAGAGGGTVQ